MEKELIKEAETRAFKAIGFCVIGAIIFLIGFSFGYHDTNRKDACGQVNPASSVLTTTWADSVIATCPRCGFDIQCELLKIKSK